MEATIDKIEQQIIQNQNKNTKSFNSHCFVLYSINLKIKMQNKNNKIITLLLLDNRQ